ncbi:hypothetical protein L1887_35595 [Cichorium endivia]|nr:hypothetical protein L1887_35595 [Cichorium endivia]
MSSKACQRSYPLWVGASAKLYPMGLGFGGWSLEANRELKIGVRRERAAGRWVRVREYDREQREVGRRPEMMREEESGERVELEGGGGIAAMEKGGMRLT